ncbi:hypothetical protein SK571_15145 [Lentzea sp. BCCO 10_0798]|uniref:Uncharacterized protein n=1 Tax=Lentzea kristufekii TaxID=3095430 RepID=A0ABU4TR05_9PSEU|nr:hypothetical protein [Lentzea sp. BCCO 10_0798]MDX8050724.1 hypothetical protein [Lentzea sp. BCCO 10_0798]
MRQRLARKLTIVAVLAGLAVHIGLGYRAGLVVAGIAIAAHLLVGVAARRAWGSGARHGRGPPVGCCRREPVEPPLGREGVVFSAGEEHRAPDTGDDVLGFVALRGADEPRECPRASAQVAGRGRLEQTWWLVAGVAGEAAPVH